MTTVHEDPDLDLARLRAIDVYDVLGRPPMPGLVSVVELAAAAVGVSKATVNLITDHEQHQVAAYGFEASVCSREDSMCNVSIAQSGPVVVPDASLDERFRHNPFVTGRLGHVRFYAAQKLITPGGVVIGTLCVFDEEPRELDLAQRVALEALAARVVDMLEIGLRNRELTRLAQRLEQASADLRTSNERLAAFAGQVAHDLRAPLAGVRMAVDMADEELDVDVDSARMLLGRATRSADRMLDLIQGVLEFARLGTEVRLEPVDLTDLVRTLLVDLGSELALAEVSVGRLPVVRGDRTLLRAVLQNLLANAARYHDPARPLLVQVSSRRTPTGWRVEVTDNGLGIDAAEAGRIFEPLTRGSASVDRPGTGVGLATCRRVLDAHGGSIGVEPLAVGSRFWFELPD